MRAFTRDKITQNDDRMIRSVLKETGNMQEICEEDQKGVLLLFYFHSLEVDR